jgi:hypothetical protein
MIGCVIVVPLVGFSSTVSEIDSECEECHSEFEAFEVIIDAPSEVPRDYDFEFRVIVRNNGEHGVQNLEALIDLSEAEYLETSMESGEPYHDEISGSVTVMGTVTYTFPVASGANQATVILDGDDGILGANDLDMTVTGPNGDTKSSANSGADEAILLTARDFRSWGYGDYSVEIVWFVGNPSISFTLTIDVEYGLNQILLEGPDLAPGEDHIFVLPLSSTDMGDNTISVALTGTAYHEHTEEDDSDATDSDVYTIEESWSITVGNRFVYEEPDIDDRGSVNVLLLERILGLLSGILLVVSIGFSSMVPWVAQRVDRIVGGAVKRIKWHCRISQVLLALSLIHGILLPFSPHASSLRGLLPGTQAFVIMGILGYIGWKQNTLRKQWGNEKWKRIHLILSILAVVIVALHAIMDGTDFAWLRG